jgi:hypothetical protein
MAKDPRTDLIQALDEAIGILAAAGEQHWRNWLERDRERITNGDAYGLEHLSGAFGGMGSFNDLVLSPAKECTRSDVELRAMDDRLYELRDQIWTGCRSLQHEVQ